MEKLYLYLAKRNRSDAKIIGHMFTNLHISASRLSGLEYLSALDLPIKERAELERVIHEHRIEWEPWIESAKDYHELRESMHRAGIAAPPSPNSSLINFPMKEISRVAELKLSKNKIMTRRMS